LTRNQKEKENMEGSLAGDAFSKKVKEKNKRKIKRKKNNVKARLRNIQVDQGYRVGNKDPI